MYRPHPIDLNQDGVLNRAVCTFSVKKLVRCSEEEIKEFHQLLLKGKKVSATNLIDRIKNCELLAFCYIKNILIAISAIKRPKKPYVDKIISKATIDRVQKDLPFEIGYSFTEEDYRRNGLSKTLKSLLLEAMKSQDGIIFSVTAIKSSQTFLTSYGFKNKGIPYDGINDIDIKYYEINIKDLK